MPSRNRDNLWKLLSNTPTASNNQPPLFFDGCELEEPLGYKPEIYEETTGEEEEEEEPFLLIQWLKIEMIDEIEKSWGFLPHHGNKWR